MMKRKITFRFPIIKTLKCNINSTNLNLSYCQLQKWPPEIDQFKNLVYLYLYCNSLKLIPPEIGKLTELKTLSIYNNSLKLIPPEINKLTKLTKLNLMNNHLKFLSCFATRDQNFKELNIWYNQIIIIPTILKENIINNYDLICYDEV